MKRAFHDLHSVACATIDRVLGRHSGAWHDRLRHDVDVLAERLDALEQAVMHNEDLRREVLDIQSVMQEWS